MCVCALPKIDGYFNLYIRLSKLQLSTPGTINCAECIEYLLSNEAVEQLRKREFTSSLRKGEFTSLLSMT